MSKKKGELGMAACFKKERRILFCQVESQRFRGVAPVQSQKVQDEAEDVNHRENK